MFQQVHRKIPEMKIQNFAKENTSIEVKVCFETHTEPKKKLSPCLSAVAVLLKNSKMSSDLHILGRTIICPTKKLLTRMNAFCRRDPLKAISTSMHEPVKFVYIFLTFHFDFTDF